MILVHTLVNSHRISHPSVYRLVSTYQERNELDDIAPVHPRAAHTHGRASDASDPPRCPSGDSRESRFWLNGWEALEPGTPLRSVNHGCMCLCVSVCGFVGFSLSLSPAKSMNVGRRPGDFGFYFYFC
jgi:hypothetical protein